jgi:hypothetical protein
MSESIPQNPVRTLAYAAPGELRPASAGVWRSGTTLVVLKRSQLPNLCVKCGNGAEATLDREVSWYPAWIYLGLVAGLLLFVIFVIRLQKKESLAIPMCARHMRTRAKRLMIAWTLGLTGLAIAIATPIYTDRPLVMTAGIIACMSGVVYGRVVASPLKAKKIDDRQIWLKGACALFLDQLPDLSTSLPPQHLT